MMKKGSVTKQNIINESLQLFSVKGYYNTSLNDILEAAHLTKGGLYGHFKSKDFKILEITRSQINYYLEQIKK